MEEIKLLFLKLRRVLYSRGHNQDDTDDLIQEAFLRLKQYDREHAVKQPEAFLVRTVLNLVADRRKHERVATMVTGALDSLPLIDPKPTPDAVFDGQERLRYFKAGLRALRPRQREVFILHRIEGYSFAQIARQLDITVSMAEKHGARAMLFLGDWMAKEGGE